MSPVQPTKVTPRTIAIMALSSVIIAVGLLVFVLISLPRLTESGQVQVQLGSDTFDAGFATIQATAIATDGPILYSDVGGGQRDIYLQHLGNDPLEGWYAFDARRAGTTRECTIRWDSDDREFIDACDDTRIDADGAGLTQFEVKVSGDPGAERLTIDLRSA